MTSPAPARCDLLVIGGGINGLGIAADASARGLSVLLVERHDFGAGTTSASSRLIHGGLRYLQYGELGLVRESLRERGLLVRRRPHLVRPIELLIPAYRGLPPPGWKVGAGLRLYDLLARDPLFPRPRRLSAAGAAEREPGLCREGLRAGFLYPDAQVEFPERLCVELARETADAGGELRTHTRVTGLRYEDGRVRGAALRDELTGEEWEAEAAVTVNAAGPWVDAVNRLLPEPPPRLIGGTWGTHLVLPPRPEGPRGPLYAAARKDGRPFFLLPWDGRLLVGTTDVPFEGDPDALRMAEWEPEYLLSETNRLFPGCRYRESDILFTTLGIRPLPASSRAAAAVTRRHFLVDHGRRHGIHGLASVVGGKLTTYRSLAETVVDWAVGECQMSNVKCQMPMDREAGGVGEGQFAICNLQFSICNSPEAPVSGRMARLYGPRCGEVLELAAAEPELARPLVAGSEAVAAEVVHAVRKEQARTVDDILRRRLMLLPPTAEMEAAVREVCRRWSLPV
jgi:glycerol-3-phosphate dehydrogenase